MFFVVTLSESMMGADTYAYYGDRKSFILSLIFNGHPLLHNFHKYIVEIGILLPSKLLTEIDY